MNKLTQFTLFLLCTFVLVFGNITFDATTFALNFWFNTLIPSMYPTMVFVSLCLHYQVFDLFSFAHKPICALFNIDKSAVGLVFSCILLGAPASTVVLNHAVKEKRLEIESAKRLLYSLSLCTPSFVILTCGSLLLGNIKIGFMLWFIQVFCCLLFLVLFRRPKISFVSTHETIPFFSVFKKSILQNAVALFYIGGYIMMFLTCFNLLTYPFSPTVHFLLLTISEFSLGIKAISTMPLNIELACVLISACLGFNGLCVHLQIFSMSDEIQPNYIKFLILRCFQASISLFLVIILFSLLQ